MEAQNKHMSWYKKVLVKEKNKIVSSAILGVVFALAILLWHFALGKNFQWETITPVPEPDFFVRSLYSALVFVTLGAFLYWIRFYQFLYHVTVGALGDWQLFRAIKGIIWGALILIMYFWIVPWVVKMLNVIVSFFFNIINLILYLFPPLGVSLIIVGVGYIILKRKSVVSSSDADMAKEIKSLNK
jgi:hypothetical protein